MARAIQIMDVSLVRILLRLIKIEKSVGDNTFFIYIQLIHNKKSDHYK